VKTFPREHDDRVHAAIHAYRLAVEYRRRVMIKWQKRADAGEKLSAIDEFHRTRVSWENDMWRSEKLTERAKEVLLTSIRGDEPFLDPYATKWFAKCRDRFFLRAQKALSGAMERKV
jgi:hypothetical protein